MPAGRPKAIDNSKVFDVAKPGKSRPISTSRPVVVNQSDAVQDDTVKVPEASTPKPLSPPSVARKIIRPISDQPEQVVAEPASSVSMVDVAVAKKTAPVVDGKILSQETSDSTDINQDVATVPKADVKPETEAPTTEATEDKTVTDTETTPSEEPATSDAPTDENKQDTPEPTETANGSESASVDALAEASEKSKESTKELEEQAKREAALQELIDSKKYVVPLAHDSTKESGSKFLIIILAFILLLAVGVYLAIDAKVLDIGINLPYHFFAQ